MNALLTTLEKLSLNIKLLLGFSSGLLIAAVIGVYGLSNLQTAQSEMEALYERELLGISHIKEANINLIYMGRAMRQALIAQDDVTRDRARTQVATARETLRKEMAEARKRIFRDEVIVKHDQFQADFAKFNENVEHALTLMEREKANPSEAAKFITSADFTAAVNAADDKLNEMTKIKERGSVAIIEQSRMRADTTRTMSLLLLGVGLALSAAFGVLIGMSIRSPNERLSRAVGNLAKGDVASAIPHTEYPNEIGVMARAIAVLQGIYRTSHEQHWVKEQVSSISALVQQAEDFSTLTQSVLSKVAPAIGAGHGAFYVTDAQGNLALLASYGYRERKHLSNTFQVGEGLVGQCAMEKAPILLTAPKDYIRISSGLGDGPPACVMVLPVIHGERVLGVLEMASFQAFAERETSVLEALLPMLAVSMEIMDRNLRTKELLASTQEQAERMEKQAAQLEEQTVEMEAQQAELRETEGWFRSIIETAPDGMLVVDVAGKILLCNPHAEALFGYAAGELIAVNVKQLVAQPELSHTHSITAQTCTGQHKDGHSLAIVLTASPLPDLGGRGRCMSLSVRAVV
jgi:PAS domain S-box-containing protein